MRAKLPFVCFFLTICHFSPLPSSVPAVEDNISNQDDYIHGLASLICYVQEAEKDLTTNESNESSEEKMTFSDEEVVYLWDKVSHALTSLNLDTTFIPRLSLFEKAYTCYQRAHAFTNAGKFKKAQRVLRTAAYSLQGLWEEAIASESPDPQLDFSLSLLLREYIDPHVQHNPYLSTEIARAIEPYLLSLKHPARSVLDNIFLNARATQDRKAFYKAGFRIIAEGPRSYICVAKHAKLRGYLVKAYLDTELREKQQKQSWEWLVHRCEGASKVRKIIQERKIRHFVVPDKWIYCFPPEPSPPNDLLHTRHLALLLVTNMHLASKRLNYYAWSHYVTPSHLNELFAIISRAKGSSYRPDNIAYTRDRTFAFIDTEYPSRGPDFKRIRKYLNPEMRDYWDRLVKRGGP